MIIKTETVYYSWLKRWGSGLRSLIFKSYLSYYVEYACSFQAHWYLWGAISMIIYNSLVYFGVHVLAVNHINIVDIHINCSGPYVWEKHLIIIEERFFGRSKYR